MILKLIIQKRSLRRVRFYIIANLTLSDGAMLLAMLIRINQVMMVGKLDSGNLRISGVLFQIIVTCTYVSSLFTTVTLAIDRYVAVKHNIRYHVIITMKRAMRWFGISWILSMTVSVLPLIPANTNFDYNRNRFLIMTTLRILTTVLLLATSKYTNTVRKRHITEIQKSVRNFGLAEEKLNLLKIVKNSLNDSFKLYVVTIIVMAVQSFVGIFEMITSEIFFGIHMFLILGTHATDITVLVLTQSEILRELKRKFLRCYKNRVKDSTS